jgi:predicted transcriptional regulator
MATRTLKITVDPDWRAVLRDTARKSRESKYQGERLNFESADLLLGKLTVLRWALVRELLGAGEVPLRELARRVGRDVKRVHGDITALSELGLVERTPRGGALCPYKDIHIDLHLQSAA